MGKRAQQHHPTLCTCAKGQVCLACRCYHKGRYEERKAVLQLIGKALGDGKQYSARGDGQYTALEDFEQQLKGGA